LKYPAIYATLNAPYSLPWGVVVSKKLQTLVVVTTQQYRILQLMNDGLTHPQIAAELNGLSTSTISSHMNTIYERANLRHLNTPDKRQKILQMFKKGRITGLDQSRGSRKPIRIVTPRQYEVLLLKAEGFTHKEIGRQLGLSPNTINNHLKDLYAALGLSSGRGNLKIALEMLEAGRIEGRDLRRK
jgi:DNA-binding NarL/FixJ family response regulator